jgi:hypothetical protein
MSGPSREIKLVLKKMASEGKLNTDAVLAEARKKTSPLHAHFQSRGAFDAKKAMLEYGRSIAGELIRSFKITIKTTKVEIQGPAYVSNPRVARSYLPIEDVRSDQDLAREVLIAEFRRAGAATARAKNVAAALDLANEVQTICDKIREVRDALGDDEGAAASH